MNCPHCGSLQPAGNAFCGSCGRSLEDSPVAPGPTPVSPSPDSGDPPGYSSGEKVVAVLMSIFMPFIALVVALVLRSSERVQARRAALKSWAIGSAAWLVTGWLVGLLIVLAVAGSIGGLGGGCRGGIDRFTPPTLTSTDNKTWTATWQCVDGGTTTRPYHGPVPP